MPLATTPTLQYSTDPDYSLMTGGNPVTGWNDNIVAPAFALVHSASLPNAAGQGGVHPAYQTTTSTGLSPKEYGAGYRRGGGSIFGMPPLVAIGVAVLVAYLVFRKS